MKKKKDAGQPPREIKKALDDETLYEMSGFRQWGIRPPSTTAIEGQERLQRIQKVAQLGHEFTNQLIEDNQQKKKQIRERDKKIDKLRPLAKEGVRAKESMKNAREIRVADGKEFKELLREAVKYMRKKHPKQSKSDSWIATELNKIAIKWKNKTPKEREELFDENSALMNLAEFLCYKPRELSTILKVIYLLKKPTPKKSTS